MRAEARHGRGSAARGANIIGGNLAAGGASQFSYENLRVYRNTVREGRGFTTVGTPWSAQVALDSAGWPTAAHTVVLWEGGNVPAWASAATISTPFKCGFIGSGTPSVASFGGCTIGNIVMGNGTTTYTTFGLYNVTTGAFGFANSAGATNVFAYMPAYPASAIDDRTQISAYTTEALAIWRNLAFLRSMWGSDVPWNTQINTSSTRRTFANTQAYQSWSGAGVEGYPQEMFMYLAKYAGIGYWPCLPAGEDGTNNAAGSYTTSVLNDILSIIVPTGQPVYIELGDEWWNGSYPAGISGTTGKLQTLAVANGFASSPTDFNGIYQYIGYKYHALANACRSVFGSNFGPGKQVQLVLSWQLGVGNSTAFPAILNYMNTTFGAPKADIQHLAVAPYMNLSNNAGDTSTALVLADLAAQAPVTPYNTFCEHTSILARFWGMDMFMYEGEWQVNTEAANSFIPLALANSAITAVLVSWGRACIDAGFKLLNWFEVGCTQANSGNTPEDELSNNYAALISTGSPQLSAIQSLAAGAYTPQRNVVSPAGSTTISLFADQLTPAPISLGTNVDFLFAFGCAPMQVQMLAPMTKTLSVNATGSGTVSVIIDDTIVASGVAITAGANVIGSFAFPAGQHAISVGSNSFQGATIDSYTFS